jgi:hypothetical protein
MAYWLWVTGLDPKNDWLKLQSFTLGGHGPTGSGVGRAKVSFDEFVISLDPGRFRSRLMNWIIRGESKTAYVFIDPQTEFEFSEAMATSYSVSDEIVTMSINFVKVKVEHSGAP